MNLKSSYAVWRSSWRFWFAIAVLIGFSPLLLDYDNKPYLCAYVLAVMALFWIFEPINLYITSLFPIALFPLFGIATTDETCANYMKGSVMMFIGGLIMGLALQHSNLHRRLALKIIIFFGSSYRNLMAGIMLATMFQSMWINNTATVAMMIPIVDSILLEMQNARDDSKRRYQLLSTSSRSNASSFASTTMLSTETSTESTSMIMSPVVGEDTKIDVNSHVSYEHYPKGSIGGKQKQSFDDEVDHLYILRKTLLLAVVYAADLGGTASLTGTGTNLVLQEIFLTKFPGSAAITFSTWLAYALPCALITIFASWLFLSYYFISNCDETSESSEIICKSSRQKYAELGSFTSHEIGVLVHFIALVALWFFRYPGWANWITDDKQQIKDATPAILIAISMFIVPSDFRQLFHLECGDAKIGTEIAGMNQKKNRSLKSKSLDIKRLLNWRVVLSGMTWGVVLLLGGGFALAHGVQKSGLAKQFSHLLTQINLDPHLTMITLMVISVFVTQMASNVATANVILPVICEMAVHMQVNPLLFIVPVTISISFAFMFPVSSPSNAIVYEHLNLNIAEIAKPGLFVVVIATTIQIVSILTFGQFMYNLDSFPDWAATANSTAVTVIATHS